VAHIQVSRQNRGWIIIVGLIEEYLALTQVKRFHGQSESEANLSKEEEPRNCSLPSYLEEDEINMLDS
jgi:hypothetical protein